MIIRLIIECIGYPGRTEGGQQKVSQTMEDMLRKERTETIFNIVKALMESMEWTAEQAMIAIKISEEDRELLIKRF